MASEYTSHYNLDLYADSDKPNLRDQYNGAINKVDQQLYKQDVNITTANNTANNAVSTANAASQAVEYEADRAKAAEAAIKKTADSANSALDTIAPFDAVPTKGSSKGVTSDGIYSALDTIAPFDAVPTKGSSKGVTSDGIFEYIKNRITYASDIGAVPTATDNSLALNNFFSSNENKILVVDEGVTLNCASELNLGNNYLICLGSLNYTGTSNTSGYMLTTNYDIEDKDSLNVFKLHCNGLIQGVSYSGGIHNINHIYVYDALGNGVYLPGGSQGYENEFNVHVKNEPSSIYANTIGVNCEKSDEWFKIVNTQNAHTAFRITTNTKIGYMHPWLVGSALYPESKAIDIAGGSIQIDELYSDTMQYAIYYDTSYSLVSIGAMFSYFNNSVVTSETTTQYPQELISGNSLYNNLSQDNKGIISYYNLPDAHKVYPTKAQNYFYRFIIFTDSLLYANDVLLLPMGNSYLPAENLLHGPTITTETPLSQISFNAHVIPAGVNSRFIYLSSDWPENLPDYIGVESNSTLRWFSINKTLVNKISKN